MPTKSQVKDKIKTSAASNWEFIDTPESWALRKENLVIQEVGIDGFGDTRDISQPDFVSLPDDQNDKETKIRVVHKGTPFDQIPALHLDGHRIKMVKPRKDRNQNVRYISDYEAKLSQIMSQDDFIRKQGNTISVEIR